MPTGSITRNRRPLLSVNRQTGRTSCWTVAIAGLFWLAGCASVPGLAIQSEPRTRGRAVAEANCAKCHAVDLTGDSRLAAAPPLRSLPERTNLLSLRSHLRRIDPRTPPEMEEIGLNDTDLEDLVAYLTSLK